MPETQPGYTPTRSLQHRLGDIDAKYCIAPAIFRQGKPGADPDLKDPASNALGNRDSRSTPLPEHPSEYES
jgi:hypothetical protein